MNMTTDDNMIAAREAARVETDAGRHQRHIREAFDRVGAALEPLEDEQRRRVLRALAILYGVTL